MIFVLCNCQSVSATSTRSCWATHHNCTLICKCDIVNRTSFQHRLSRMKRRNVSEAAERYAIRPRAAAANRGFDELTQLSDYDDGTDRCVFVRACVCMRKACCRLRNRVSVGTRGHSSPYLLSFLLPDFLCTPETASYIICHINCVDGQTV